MNKNLNEKTGLCVLYSRPLPNLREENTTSIRRAISLTFNENADSTVLTDMKTAVEALSPDCYEAASVYMGPSLLIPFYKGSFVLGTWQGIYLCNWGQQSGDVELIIIPHAATERDLFTVVFKPPHSGVYNISNLIINEIKNTFSKRNLEKENENTGLLFVKTEHTSASLTVNGPTGTEGFSPHNLNIALDELVPEKWSGSLFKHTSEGPDDMPGHVKSSLIGATALVPLCWFDSDLSADNNLKKTNIYFCEHRNSKSNRKISILNFSLKNNQLDQVDHIIFEAGSYEIVEKREIFNVVKDLTSEFKFTGSWFVICETQGASVVASTSKKYVAAAVQNLNKISKLQKQSKNWISSFFKTTLAFPIDQDGDWKNDPPKLFIINHYKEKRAIELKIVLKAAQ